MTRRIRAHDWSATPLGPIAGWPAALRISLGMILDSPAPTVLAWGPDLITFYNDAYRPLLGHKPEALGRPYLEVWSEAGDVLRPQIADALAGRASRFENAPFMLLRGERPEQAFFDYSYSPVRDETGAVAGLLNTAVETTGHVLAVRERRAAEERHAFLLRLGDALRPLTLAVDVQTTAMRLLAEQLGVVRATYFEVDDDEDGFTLTARYERDPAPIPEHMRMSSFAPDISAAYRGGATLVVRDTEVEARLETQRAEYRAIGVRAWLGVPLVKDRRLVAIVGAHSRTPRDWSDAEVRLLEEVAERTWAAVERARAEIQAAAERDRAETAMRESEERLGLAVEIGELASWDWDMHTDKVRWNDRHYLLQGYAVGEVTPSFQAWIARVHPDDRAQTTALIEKARDDRSVYVHDFRILHPDGRVDWASARGRFFYDAEGAPFRMLGVMQDVTERRRVEDALRAAQARQVFLLRLADALRPLGDRGAMEEAAARLLEDHLAVDGAFYAPADEKALRGEVAERTSAAVQRAEAAKAMRESEERFRQFAEASSDVLWIRSAEDLVMEYLSPAFERVYGAGRQGVLGQGTDEWSVLIHPDDRADAVAALEQVRAGAPVTHAFRIVRPGGEVRWIETTDFPLFGAEGRLQRIGGFARDVTETRQAAERQRLLLAELHHRVRNILAMVRSLVRRSGESARSVQELNRHLEGRIDALARTQVMLTRRAGAGIDLSGLVLEELVAQAADNDRVTVAGPPIMIAPKAAEVLALAVHELATNATKYGAFAQAEGRLRVDWDIDEEAGELWLRLDWAESGVAIKAAASPHKGFGMELIRKRVPYELRGRGAIEVRPDGVRCRLEFPLRLGDSILDTREPSAGGLDGRH